MVMEPEYYVLENGIRLVHIPTQSPVAHLGVFINTGTRDEPEGKTGMAHFIEHMIFKGTEHRKAFHILNRLESVGGELNAFTTKEYTCIYTSFLNTWYARAAELLSDIIFHSVFPKRELEKEKSTIALEMLFLAGRGTGVNLSLFIIKTVCPICLTYRNYPLNYPK